MAYQTCCDRLTALSGGCKPSENKTMNTPQDFTYDLTVAERNACKGLKVGQYWNKYTDKQKLEFCRLYAKQYNVNPIRGFLTACKKQFGDRYQVIKMGLVSHNNENWSYSTITQKWYKV